jgi:hypothetical protein
MNVNLKKLDIGELRPRITIFGVGGAGGNAVNNMINAGLQGVVFVVANTDAQALITSRAERIIQMGVAATGGLGAGSQPDVGRAAAEEVFDEIRNHLTGAHMVFVTAGMGGGTGTGASPVVARAARELGILTIGARSSSERPQQSHPDNNTNWKALTEVESLQKDMLNVLKRTSVDPLRPRVRAVNPRARGGALIQVLDAGDASGEPTRTWGSRRRAYGRGYVRLEPVRLAVVA